MMKLSYFVIALVLLAAAGYCVSQRSGAVEITQAGNDLSIAVGDHRIQAAVGGPEFTDSFLVIGGMRGSDLHFTTLLAVIPLDRAEALAAQYGDFRRCDSPGAAAGKDSVEPMVLYAAGGSAERTLKRINKLALAGKDPVIEMTFFLLDITEHKIVKGQDVLEIPLLDIGPSFVVNHVRLMREGLAP